MVETALQKSDKIPDNEVVALFDPWSREARWPPPITAHPGARDIILRSLEVEVVRHRRNRHEIGDKAFIVLDPWGWRAERELVTCLPDPLL